MPNETLVVDKELLRTVITETVKDLFEKGPRHSKIRLHPDTKYLRPKQAEILLGVSHNTIDKMSALGLITPIRMSSRFTLYERSEIVNLIEQVKHGLVELPLDDSGV